MSRGHAVPGTDQHDLPIIQGQGAFNSQDILPPNIDGTPYRNTVEGSRIASSFGNPTASGVLWEAMISPAVIVDSARYQAGARSRVKVCPVRSMLFNRTGLLVLEMLSINAAVLPVPGIWRTESVR